MKIALALILTVAAFGLRLQADDTERSFTLDLASSGQAQALPSWMTGQPMASPSDHATVSFPIAPPQDDSNLAVTFYFQETAGGFLRVYWAGAQTNEMLSENLFEGIEMPNQRTLLIKRATLSSPGTLSVQSSENTLNVSRIHWQWVEPAPVSLADEAAQSALVNAGGKVLDEGEINGAPLLPLQDKITGSVVTAALTEKPERIETGVEFVATLQTVPPWARMELEISGAPPGKPVLLWINGEFAGEVSVELPDLTDPGYQQGSGGGLSYVGWRKGVLFVPVTLLKAGDNQFQFGLKDVAPSPQASPLAVKNLLLQLKYGGAPAPSATPPAEQPLEIAPAINLENPTPKFRNADLKLLDPPSTQP